MSPEPHASAADGKPSQRRVIATIGVTQILGYGTSYYLLPILGLPIAADTGWPLTWVIAGLSIGMLIGGLASPMVGGIIERWGGRRVLAAGSVLLAAGLVGVGSATRLDVYLAAWCVVGLGMAAGLYEAVFPALGRLYGAHARRPITTVTLIGGFASTVCWPLSAYLYDAVGWRWTCFIYAASHLLIALPLHLTFPARVPDHAAAEPASAERPPVPAAKAISHRSLILGLVVTHLTFTSIVATIISVHLLVIVEHRGYHAAAAVALGTLLGPSQVAGRAIELVFGRAVHPLWSAIACSTLIAAGVGALAFNFPVMALAVIVFAAGAGVSYIVRGTLPLALFGPVGYATLMGKLALPSLVAQALAPWAAAFAFTRTGIDAFLVGLFVLALANLAILAIAATLTKAEKPPAGQPPG